MMKISELKSSLEPHLNQELSTSLSLSIRNYSIAKRRYVRL